VTIASSTKDGAYSEKRERRGDLGNVRSLCVPPNFRVLCIADPQINARVQHYTQRAHPTDLVTLVTENKGRQALEKRVSNGGETCDRKHREKPEIREIQYLRDMK
jgi:hypothetical protein